MPLFIPTVARSATEGARLAVTFSGLEMGIFSGELQYTVYRGSNLLRQEAIAKTNEPSVAYIYSAGLKGFDIAKHPAVVWRDSARAWQKYEFGGATNTEPVGVARPQPAGHRGCRQRIAGRVPASAQVFLRA